MQFLCAALRARLQHDRCHNGPAAIRVRKPGRGSLCDSLVVQNCRFDLTRLDANATHLDLIVIPAEVVQHAVCITHRDVTAAIQSLATYRDESFLGQLVVVAVAACHA